MAHHSVCSVFFTVVCILKFCVGQYAVPEVKFEAFTPKGLRISIPADKGVELFAFHGKVNKPILQIEPGEFSEDVTRPTDGRFTYINPSIKLKEGDVINYWVFVQHEQLGFRKEDQKWTVDRLFSQRDLDKSPGAICSSTITRILDRATVCSGDEVINYRFTETNLNSDLWLMEQFIPNEPDWEYVIYKNDPEVIAVENNVLRIRPKVVPENAKKPIVIDGCTREGNVKECSSTFDTIYLPFIFSGRIVTKTAFCFGNITVKAKLPQGDWIFPEIYLEDINDPKRRLLLAYARGNNKLVGKNLVDIGGKMIFGGPYKSPKEPRRSTHLSSYLSSKHIGADWHVFTVIWTKDQIELFLDDINYGIIKAESLKDTGFDQEETMVRLVLGVGVAGLNDFPDGYLSGTEPKPWRNQARDAIKNFLTTRDIWQKTWSGDSQLLVEYVTVAAV